MLCVVLAMAQWDTNKDGVITREEFKKGLSRHGMSVIMGSEVDEIFDTVDDNGESSVQWVITVRAVCSAVCSVQCSIQYHSVPVVVAHRSYPYTRCVHVLPIM
jgi:hypothetical protein